MLAQTKCLFSLIFCLSHVPTGAGAKKEHRSQAAMGSSPASFLTPAPSSSACLQNLWAQKALAQGAVSISNSQWIFSVNLSRLEPTELLSPSSSKVFLMLILPELCMKNHFLLFVVNPDPISLIFFSSCNERGWGHQCSLLQCQC